MTGTLALGIDVGGSGTRAGLVAVVSGARSSPPLLGRTTLRGAQVGVHGTTLGTLAVEACRWALSGLPSGEGPAAVCVGATGLATLVADPRTVVSAVAEVIGAPVPVAVCIDAVTAHLGALGGRAGAVVAAGTGAIALGTDLAQRWHRVDGWGHLLGDLGSGSWIGRLGLQAAAGAHDGRRTGSSSALLEMARTRFGDVESWPSVFYRRDDRAALLASFAPDVARAAGAGDQAARQIVVAAGEHLAEAADAALATDVPERVAGVGGVFRIGGELVRSFGDTLRDLRPEATIVDAAGGPFDGALRGAVLLATGEFPPEHPPYVFRADGA